MNILDQLTDNPAMMFQTAHDAEQEIINTLIELDRMNLINAETVDVPYAPIFHKGAYYAVIFIGNTTTSYIQGILTGEHSQEPGTENLSKKIQFI